MSQEPFEATIGVIITHRSGPELPPEHVVAWIVADGQRPGSLAGGFVFRVCPQHPDPDLCDGCFGVEDAAYGARFDTADLPKP